MDTANPTNTTSTATTTPGPETPEARLAGIQRELESTQRLLTQAREALDASERRRSLERQLSEEGAIDLETATLLTEAAVAGMDEPDLARAVRELKARKPFLFRAAPRRSVMSGTPTDPGDASPLEDAAAAARESGDRHALLRYLRLRRA
jgi:hypothetical protein